MRKHFVFSLLFLTLIFFPFLGNFVFHGPDDNRLLKTENRYVTKMTRLKGLQDRNIRSFFNNKSQYIADRLLYKEEIIRPFSRFLHNPTYFTSVDFDQVVVGQHGWTFLGNHQDVVFDRHIKKKGYDEPPTTADTHRILEKSAKQLGASYTVFVIPDKHGVYCENLPLWIQNSNICNNPFSVTHRQVNQLESHGIDILFAGDYLRNQALCSNVPLYYKTDSHWNDKGAELGFLFLMQYLQKKISSLRLVDYYQLIPIRTDNVGDIAVSIGMNSADSSEISFKLVFPESKTIQWKSGNQPERAKPIDTRTKAQSPKFTVQVINNQAPNKTRIMIIGDSFLSALAPFFNANFSNIQYASRNASPTFLKQLLIDFNPNHVIFETVERRF